jgi:hypothetical protein
MVDPDERTSSQVGDTWTERSLGVSLASNARSV